jgi:peptide/nickel transport system substrate-binding protein
MLKKLFMIMALLLALPLILAACQPQPDVREVTRVVTEVQTEVIEVEGEERVIEREVTVVITEREEVVVPATPEAPAPVDRMGAWVDTVVVVGEPSADSAVTRLDVGDIDLYSFGIAVPETFARIEASQNLKYARAFGNYDEMSFNPAGPVFENGNFNPFWDAGIREAVNWLIDREFIAQELYGGMAVPRYTALNTVSNDYALLADVVRGIELAYAHDPERAEAVITERMEDLGATMVGGLWQYEGEPVEIIMLIRTEDTRLQVGDYLSNLLEDLGFTVTRDYRTAAEAGPIWLTGDPTLGQWHVYTGGWVSTVVSRDLGGNFAFFYTDTGRGEPLWQTYVNDPEFYDLAVRLDNNDFRTVEERREMMGRALELSMEDSYRVWVVDRAPVFPMRQEISVSSDLSGGVNGSWLWAHTLRRDGEVGGSVRMATASILTQPWNPLDGSNWIFDQQFIRGTGESSTMPDPFTGLAWPNRIERAEVFTEEGLPVGVTHDWLTHEFVSSIDVPEDAWIDWDAAEQRFITVGEAHPEGLAALQRVVVYYPDDLYDTVAWHDGSPFSIGDIVMYMILRYFDRTKEESAVFDATKVAEATSFMASFRGVRILSEDPLVIETYRDNFNLDAEQLGVATWWPYYPQGQGAWHTLAIGLLAEAAEEAAFSGGKANTLDVDRLNYISGPTVGILREHLDVAMAENLIPYEATLGQFISAEEAEARYRNLDRWHRARGHFWVGTGPFFMERAFPVEGTLILQRNPNYPDPADRWDRFAEPPVPEAEIDGPTRVTIGSEVTFDLFLEFAGEPYPVEDIREVKFLILDATGALAHVGEAEAIEDGLWQITLTSDVTSQLEAGSNRLEVVAVSYLVARPATDALLFVTAP